MIPNIFDSLPTLLVQFCLFLAGLVVALMVVLLADISQRSRLGLWGTLHHSTNWFKNHLVGLTSILVLIVTGSDLVSSVRADTPTSSTLYLAGGMLLAAVLLQYGNDLLQRITKIGPVEFSPQELVDLDLQFDDISDLRLRVIADGTHLAKFEMSSENMTRYRKFQQLIWFAEWSGMKQSDLPRGQNFRDSLAKLSAVAIQLEEFSFAVECGVLQKKVANDRLGQKKALKKVGTAFFDWASSSQESTEVDKATIRRLYENGREEFEELRRMDPDDFETHFLLGYIYDEMAEYDLAIQSNRAALNIRSRSAATKYNLAISQLKQGWLDDAHVSLGRISPGDAGLKGLLKTWENDPEVWQLDAKIWGGDTDLIERYGKWKTHARRLLTDLQRPTSASRSS